MNYGYDSTCEGWKPARKRQLADKLSEIVARYREPGTSRNPHVEVDGAYKGVRVRGMTHLPEERHERLIGEMEVAYEVVMGLPIGEGAEP